MMTKPSVKKNFGTTVLDDASYINYNITDFFSDLIKFLSNVAMPQHLQSLGSLSHNFQTCASVFVSEEAPVSARCITIASPVVWQAAGNPLVT